MVPNTWMNDTARQLSEGAFLMIQGNPMTIGWAQFGVLWGKQCATVYVRQSRYSHALLKNAGTFTISVPEAKKFKKELAFCGTRSGRDFNKMETLGLTYSPARFGGADGVVGCALHIECRILYRIDLGEDRLEDASIKNVFYKNGDTHTMVIGEILGVRAD